MTWPSTPNRWKALWDEFDGLADLDSVARARHLDALRQKDPQAHQLLTGMLAADESANARLAEVDSLFPAVRAKATTGRDELGLLGQLVARFQVVELLGSGGMGAVYRAIDPRLGRQVALKVPLRGHMEPGIQARFLQEARAAAALDHQNVCSIFEAGETAEGLLYFAMPLYSGETLAQRLSRDGALRHSEALGIARQIAEALQAAHAVGIVHRDLKPGNIMLLQDGTIRVLDFGIARVPGSMLTRSHATMGTIAYMAPEGIRGVTLDASADLWSLGVLLFEMLTGQRPFDGGQDISVAWSIVHGEIPVPSARRPEVPGAVDPLVRGLLTREPQHRLAPADVLQNISTILRAPDAAARSESKPRRRTGPRRPTVMLTAGVLASTILGGALWLRPASAHWTAANPRPVMIEAADTALVSEGLAADVRGRLAQLSSVMPSEGTRDARVRVGARSFGDQVALTLSVTDSGTSRQILERTYNGTAATLPALHARALSDLVRALELEVPTTESAPLRAIDAQPEAVAAYLRGRGREVRARAGASSAWLSEMREAQLQFNRARDLDLQFADPRAQLALSHVALARRDSLGARLDQARVEAEAALRLQPEMPDAHLALADYWLALGNRTEAVSQLQRALVRYPNSPDLHVRTGIALRQLGRWDEAVSALERASRLAPNNRGYHVQAAITYARGRNYRESIAHWDRVIAIDSAREPYPQMIRGYHYLRLGNLDSLDAAIARIPIGKDLGGIAGDSGRGLVTHSHYTSHRMQRRSAAELAVLDSISLPIIQDGLLYLPVELLRARAHESAKDTAAAVRSYRRVLPGLRDSSAKYPADLRMRASLGLAYAGLGQERAAVAEAERLTEAARAMPAMEERTAFLAGALEIYARLRRVEPSLQLIELLMTMPAGRELSVPLLEIDPAYDGLRADPRFQAQLRRLASH